VTADGYRQIIRFSQVSLLKGNLIIDCPIHNDALVLVRQFGTDLHPITLRLRIVETRLNVLGDDLQATPAGLLFGSSARAPVVISNQADFFQTAYGY